MRRRSRVARLDDARARRAELVGLAPHLVERLLQRGVELHVVEREADLAGELGERLVVVLVERQRAVGPAHDDHAEQLARVGDRRDPQHLVVVAGGSRAARSAPTPRPTRRRARRPSPPRGPSASVAGPAVGHRHRALEAAAAPRVHTSATLERHRLLQRLRELEEQLVERERAREAAAERAQHLVGRVPFAVDAPRRELGESLAHRDPEQRGDRGREHREPEQRLLVTGRLRDRARAR